MSAKISKIEAIPYRLPLNSALSWGAHSTLSTAEHVLVRVHLTDGNFGTAEATPRPTIYGETSSSVVAILGHLECSLLGLDITDQVALNSARNSVANNQTARGALDMALWDARAGACGKTLFDTVAGKNTKVKASFILGIASHKEMLEEAKRVADAGVRCLKVKVGRQHQKDLLLIKELRAEFGDDFAIYADSNETLSPETAPEAMKAMHELGLMYVEEPLPVRQIKERAELKSRDILPIVADDSCFSPLDLKRELSFDTFDVLNVKTARNGFSDGIAMLQTAKANGKRGMVGSQASSGLGTIHAALLSSRPEVTEPCELSFVLKLTDDLLNQDICFKDGYLDINTLREHAIDEKKLLKYRI